MDTGIFRTLPWPLGPLCKLIAPYLYRTAKEGASTSVFCALSDEAEGHGGEYFDACVAYPASEEARLKADSLWEESERLLAAALKRMGDNQGEEDADVEEVEEEVVR